MLTEAKASHAEAEATHGEAAKAAAAAVAEAAAEAACAAEAAEADDVLGDLIEIMLSEGVLAGGRALAHKAPSPPPPLHPPLGFTPCIHSLPCTSPRNSSLTPRLCRPSKAPTEWCCALRRA